MPDPFPSGLTGRPFTRSEAASYGITARQLDARRVLRVHRGVRLMLADGEQPDLRQRVGAALKVLPADTVITGVTGLQLHGIDIGPRSRLTLCTTHPHPIRRPGIIVSRISELPPHTGRLASPADCFAAAATELDLVDAVTAGDWLLHLGRATPDDLAAAVGRRSRRNIRRVRRALELVRSRVESPRETRLRLVLVLAGLPEPEINPRVVVDGIFLGRADLLFRAYRLVVEYDGLQHLNDRLQWKTDIQRLERFASAEHRVVRVTAARLASPRRLVLDVHRLLVAQGYQGSGPVFTPEWLACFSR